MLEVFSNILTIDFVPLSEIKAKLSAMLRSIQTGSKKLVITQNGRPAAVLIAYQDYLNLISQLQSSGQTTQDAPRIIDFDQWKKDIPQRKKISASITKLFDTSLLSRKGQKSYKRETLREFKNKSKKRS